MAEWTIPILFPPSTITQLRKKKGTLLKVKTLKTRRYWLQNYNPSIGVT